MNRFVLTFISLFFTTFLIGQNIDHLAGKWKDNSGNIFILEKAGEQWRWKNEKSQIWTNINLVSGTNYADNDGYKYEFNEKKGSLKIINPDNERDVKTVTMIDFRKPEAQVKASPPPNESPEPQRQSNPAPVKSSSDEDRLHGFMLGYRGSINAPIGFVLGGISKGKGGLYFSFRTSQISRPQSLSEKAYNSNGVHEITDGDATKSYSFTGYTQKTRGAITLGYMIPIQSFLSISAGLGYGWARTWDLYDVYDLNTGELNNPDQQDYGVSESSKLGLEFEVIGSYHYKKLFVSTGLSMVNFSNADVVLGIGVLLY